MTASVPLSVAGLLGARVRAAREAVRRLERRCRCARGGTRPATQGRERPDEVRDGRLDRGRARSAATCRRAATGTVSYIDGNKVLAFGHPMFQTGETYAPVATATVHTVIPSAQSAFVMASPINEIGSLVAGSPVRDRRRHEPAHADDPGRHLDHERRAASTAEKGTFHVEMLDNKFLTPSIDRRGADERDQLLPARPRRRHRAASSRRSDQGRTTPIEFVDYLYANDGAGSVMGAVRGLRVLVPLLLNPYAPVTIERVDIKVDLRFEANYGDIKEIRVPTGELDPGRAQHRPGADEHVGRQGHRRGRAGRRADVARRRHRPARGHAPATRAKLDAAPPVDLPSLLAAFRKLLPGNVWAVTLYPADEGVALDGKLVRDLPASAQDKLHPQSHTQRARPYKPLTRTVAPAKRVVNGSPSMLVRVRARRRRTRQETS